MKLIVESSTVCSTERVRSIDPMRGMGTTGVRRVSRVRRLSWRGRDVESTREPATGTTWAVTACTQTQREIARMMRESAPAGEFIQDKIFRKYRENGKEKQSLSSRGMSDFK